MRRIHEPPRAPRTPRLPTSDLSWLIPWAQIRVSRAQWVVCVVCVVCVADAVASVVRSTEGRPSTCGVVSRGHGARLSLTDSARPPAGDATYRRRLRPHAHPENATGPVCPAAAIRLRRPQPVHGAPWTTGAVSSLRISLVITSQNPRLGYFPGHLHGLWCCPHVPTQIKIINNSLSDHKTLPLPPLLSTSAVLHKISVEQAHFSSARARADRRAGTADQAILANVLLRF